MTRIQIDEPPPFSITLAMTAMRSITGTAIALAGVQTLSDLQAWQGELARLGLPSATAICAAGGAVAVGLGLVLGWLTRIWSVVLLAASTTAIALSLAHGAVGQILRGSFTYLERVEYLSMLATVSVVLLASGAGRLSADRWLSERARCRAILSDARWSCPPYVSTQDDAPRAPTVRPNAHGTTVPQRM